MGEIFKDRKPGFYCIIAALLLAGAGSLCYVNGVDTRFGAVSDTAVLAFMAGFILCGLALISDLRELRFAAAAVLLWAGLAAITSQVNYITNVLVGIDGNSFTGLFLGGCILPILAFIAALIGAILAGGSFFSAKTGPWAAIGGVCILLFVLLVVADQVTTQYQGLINKTLGIETTVVETTEDGEQISYERSFADTQELAAYLEELGTRAESGGIVLLKNENGALPLSRGDKLSLMFMGSTAFNYSASGSGGADSSTYPTLKEALSGDFAVNETLWSFYTEGEGAATSRQTRGAMYGRTENLDGGVTVYQAREINWSKYTDTEIASIEEYDTVVFTISRSSGEGKDVSATGSDGHDGSYLSLTEDEISVMSALTQMKKEGRVKKLVVLLNTSAQFQCDFLADEAFCTEYGIDIDAALWVGNVGKSGINAIPQILTGDVNPSGRLSDTYLVDNMSSPAMQSWMVNGWFSSDYTNADELGLLDSQRKYAVYQEGIYVGYRYYETRYEDYVLGAAGVGAYDYAGDVAYPFGYGLSYTDFAYSDYAVTDNGNGSYTVSVTVTNTGAAAGRHAVEVYLQKPYTDYDRENGVEKAAVELAGFAKTQLLEPGGSETVSVMVEKYAFKSYDANGAQTYILDAGDYYLTVAADAHAAVNNILAAKGYTAANTAGRMDADGDASLASVVWTNPALDTETFAQSIYTGETITNEFDFCDVNRYEGSGDNSVVYVSRSDWEGTMPQAPAELSVATTQMAFDISSNKGAPEEEGAVMPAYGADNGLTLAQMYGLDYDDPLWDDLLDQLSFEDTANLLSGNYLTIALESVAKPATSECDGPTGDTYSITQTSFPCEGIWASSFDAELIREIGAGYAEDAVATGHSGVYAPGVNIHRVPFGGRSAEYFSEDPFLSGMACSYEVQGLQSRGVIAHVKHFAFNDQDTDRAGISVWLSEQEAREIMLVPFEYALTQTNDNTSAERGSAHAVMTAFSRVGCEWAGATENMLIDVLHGEWNFDGFNITDMAQSNGAEFMTYEDGVMRGTDQFLKDGTADALSAYKNNATFCQKLRESAHRLLYTVANHSVVMNGYTVNTKVIVITAWWQKLLRGAEIAAAVIGFGGAAAYVVVGCLKKKRA